MSQSWQDNQPIYRQIRDQIAASLLDASIKDGEALPSVREVAASSSVNPLTVLKAYQLLVDEGLVESRRGRGMFVVDGARDRLVKIMRAQFLETEWPKIIQQIQQLDLDWQDLVRRAEKTQKRNPE